MSFSPDELKIVSISGHTWLNMLRDRETKLFNRIYGEYQNGKTDFLTLIAEFSVIRSQINEIKSVLKINLADKGD